jgi:hypothetical protein
LFGRENSIGAATVFKIKPGNSSRSLPSQLFIAAVIACVSSTIADAADFELACLGLLLQDFELLRFA